MEGSFLSVLPYHYLGGITAEAVTNSILEFKLNHEYTPAKL